MSIILEDFVSSCLFQFRTIPVAIGEIFFLATAAIRATVSENKISQRSRVDCPRVYIHHANERGEKQKTL